MSATYRIELIRDPHSAALPWDARIIRLSDNRLSTICTGTTRYTAADAARQWVRDEESPLDLEHGNSFYVDDQGRDAEAPQSVKV
jgi:hypothetical protein